MICSIKRALNASAAPRRNWPASSYLLVYILPADEPKTTSAAVFGLPLPGWGVSCSVKSGLGPMSGGSDPVLWYSSSAFQNWDTGLHTHRKVSTPGKKASPSLVSCLNTVMSQIHVYRTGGSGPWQSPTSQELLFFKQNYPIDAQLSQSVLTEVSV